MANFVGSIFDLEEDRKGTFKIAGGGSIELKLICQAESKEIYNKCKRPPKYVLAEGVPFRDDADSFDNDLWTELFWKKAIVKWTEIFDSHKNEIKFTPDNISKMMANRKFNEMVQANYLKLKEESTSQNKAEEGN